MTTGSSTHETEQTELASRQGNGITVRMLWSRATNLMTVAVADLEFHSRRPKPEVLRDAA
jgi:hypothetical protein